jgi:hypothetical protein
LLQAWGDKKGMKVKNSFNKPSRFGNKEALGLVDMNQPISKSGLKESEFNFESIYNSSERSRPVDQSDLNNLKENFDTRSVKQPK